MTNALRLYGEEFFLAEILPEENPPIRPSLMCYSLLVGDLAFGSQQLGFELLDEPTDDCRMLISQILDRIEFLLRGI